jgi:uncharacterized protein YndB with AHSA1/START domain
MPDDHRSIRVAAQPEVAFAFLADPHHLPRYVATVVKAEPQPDGTLRVAAQVQGRHEEGDALLQVDPAHQRMDWSAPDNTDYSGSLHVSATDAGSQIHLHLHLSREQDQAEINRVLDQTAANIQQLLTDA